MEITPVLSKETSIILKIDWLRRQNRIEDDEELKRVKLKISEKTRKRRLQRVRDKQRALILKGKSEEILENSIAC